MGLFNKLFGGGKKNQSQTISLTISDAYHDLAERAMAELRLKTSAHDSAWGLGEADWSIDQDEQTIVFTSDKGITATCSVQIVGTYNTKDSTWLWGWDHPSVQPPLDEHAKAALAYGQENAGFELLTTRDLPVTEQQAWELSAIACHLSNAQGAFRCPSDPTMAFVTFDNVKLSGDGAAQAKPLNVQMDRHQAELAADQVPQDILDIVTGYIADYYKWNQDAFAMSDSAGDDKADQQIQDAHDQIVSKWYSSQTTPQGISYGSESMHDPSTEKIQGATVTDDTAIVITTPGGQHSGNDQYEYHLIKKDGAWKLRQMYYVDDDSKYESL